MERLLVTGGTGYLGRAVVRRARRMGWQVAATFHQQPPPTDETTETDITWLPLDVRAPQDVTRLCERVQPAVVIHTAFRQQDPDMWDINALGAHNVAAAAYTSGAHLIHMSTDVIFDGTTTSAYTEEEAPNPITAYGASKADAEHFVRSAHPQATLVRTSLIYGMQPIDRHTQFILDIADGRATARLFTDEYRCPVFVEDLAAALLELTAHSSCGIINIAGAETLSRHAFGCLLAAFHGRDPAQLAPGTLAGSGLQRPANCALDIRRAQGMLRTPLRSVREVLAHPFAPALP